MKIRLKFSFFFVIGLFVLVLYIGICVALFQDYIYPSIGIQNPDDNAALMLGTIFLIFVSASLLISHYFIEPFLYMLSFIKILSQKNTSIVDRKWVDKKYSKIMNAKGKIKKQFFLYKELILDLHNLSEQLLAIEQERAKLEEEKSAWIRDLSHDIKTPLSYIVGYSTLLQKEDYEWEENEKEEFIELIHCKGKEIEDLVEDMKYYFQSIGDIKGPPLNVTRYNMVSLMNDLVSKIIKHPKASKCEIRTSYEHSEIYVEADERLIRRCIENIIMNSIIHNMDNIIIDIVLRKSNENLVVEIADNGIGFRSQNVKSENGSWGIGLEIVNNIVSIHGGKINFTKVNPQGTKIELCLPILGSKK